MKNCGYWFVKYFDVKDTVFLLVLAMFLTMLLPGAMYLSHYHAGFLPEIVESFFNNKDALGIFFIVVVGMIAFLTLAATLDAERYTLYGAFVWSCVGAITMTGAVIFYGTLTMGWIVSFILISLVSYWIVIPITKEYVTNIYLSSCVHYVES